MGRLSPRGFRERDNSGTASRSRSSCRAASRAGRPAARCSATGCAAARNRASRRPPTRGGRALESSSRLEATCVASQIQALAEPGWQGRPLRQSSAWPAYSGPSVSASVDAASCRMGLTLRSVAPCARSGSRRTAQPSRSLSPPHRYNRHASGTTRIVSLQARRLRHPLDLRFRNL